MDIKAYMQSLGVSARAAGRVMARSDSGVKNKALLAIAEALDEDRALLAGVSAAVLSDDNVKKMTVE